MVRRAAALYPVRVTREFFEQVADAVIGFVPPELGHCSTRLTSGNVKVWFGDEAREHYEAQFLRDGRLEIGFHAEHRRVEDNESVIARLLDRESEWRGALGAQATAGPFVDGEARPWRRISEVTDPPDPEDVDAALEVADRLAAYVEVLEPIRTT